MQALLLVATALQVVAVVYCVLLLRKHWIAATAWLALLGALLSMLVWRIVVSSGVSPGPVFNTAIAIWGSVCAVVAMFYFSREMARRERAEADRDRLLASERSARGDAERANRIKDEFLATLSHELRTPLAAILGWCGILRASADADQRERATETIERNARLQARLVDDLLDATRMQAGSLSLELAPVPLDGPVSAAADAIRPEADAKQVGLTVRCAHPAPVVVGDANRLQQVAANLLVNAVKFTPPGRGVTVTIDAEGDEAILTVADQGVGIDPAFVPQLFQRFRQADSSRTRRQGGLGLGLSIAAQLVQLHHGQVTAASAGRDRGATFTIRLPRTTTVAATLRPLPAGAPGTGAASIAGVRALVVDDEADVRGAIASLLEQAGAVALALESGTAIDEAIAEFRPDVLVLDIGMPGEDGYTLIRRIRRLEHGAAVPAVALTAYARDEDRRHALACGFQAHLAKPLDMAALVSTIHTLIPPAGGRPRRDQRPIADPAGV